LGACLLLSRGEEAHGGRDRPSALADAFEAVLGAVFLDAGFEAVRIVILGQFGSEFQALRARSHRDNPKGELQEFLQAKSTEPPHYALKDTSGPDHDRFFECAVYHGGVELARGTGKSKKAAESQAALAALERLEAEAATAPDAQAPPASGGGAPSIPHLPAASEG
jgi:ribonuclease-3